MSFYAVIPFGEVSHEVSYCTRVQQLFFISHAKFLQGGHSVKYVRFDLAYVGPPSVGALL